MEDLRDVGLGFRTPKTAIEGSYIGTFQFAARNTCKDNSVGCDLIAGRGVDGNDASLLRPKPKLRRNLDKHRSVTSPHMLLAKVNCARLANTSGITEIMTPELIGGLQTRSALSPAWSRSVAVS